MLYRMLIGSNVVVECDTADAVVSLVNEMNGTTIPAVVEPDTTVAPTSLKIVKHVPRKKYGKQACPYCSDKVKHMALHVKRNHPDKWPLFHKATGASGKRRSDFKWKSVLPSKPVARAVVVSR